MGYWFFVVLCIVIIECVICVCAFVDEENRRV